MIGTMEKKKENEGTQLETTTRKKERKKQTKKFDVHIWANRHDF